MDKLVLIDVPKLKPLFAQAGWAQPHIADHIGVHKNTVLYAFKGERMLGVENYIALVNLALDVLGKAAVMKCVARKKKTATRRKS